MAVKNLANFFFTNKKAQSSNYKVESFQLPKLYSVLLKWLS